MAARDVILIGALIFAFALTFLSLHYMFNSAIDQMVINPEIASSNRTVEVLEKSASISNRYDYVLFVVFIGMLLALIITGWFIGGHPLFMVIYFLFVVVAVVLGAIFANVWETVSQTSILSSSLNAFPLTNNIMLFLPIYLSIVGFIGVIIMFAKPQA